MLWYSIVIIIIELLIYYISMGTYQYPAFVPVSAYIYITTYFFILTRSINNCILLMPVRYIFKSVQIWHTIKLSSPLCKYFFICVRYVNMPFYSVNNWSNVFYKIGGPEQLQSEWSWDRVEVTLNFQAQLYPLRQVIQRYHVVSWAWLVPMHFTPHTQTQTHPHTLQPLPLTSSLLYIPLLWMNVSSSLVIFLWRWWDVKQRAQEAMGIMLEGRKRKISVIKYSVICWWNVLDGTNPTVTTPFKFCYFLIRNVTNTT